MTPEEEKTIKQSQEKIKSLSKQIGENFTQILLLGGPLYVEALLASLTKANDDLKKQMKMNVTTEFK